MGKETDLLQAAQTGDLTKLENLLTPKSSVFSGLFKGPNVNWRDESGYTALHLAALNGHKDVVIFLLHNDASANTPDNAGSFPLHLAAFNGHDEVAKLLISRGPSRARVNETNMAGDTALHVAAQYGHRPVVQVLLEFHADPAFRNNKEETALDLAAQYGKLTTVQLFLFFDPILIKNAVHKHSPLHLAARNGHDKVVELLLDSGMPVNATCDMGTALHCAALYGKVSVAKLLLEKGIDITIEDDNGQQVLDVLCKHPSQRSQEITALIYEQSDSSLQKKKKNSTRTPSASYSGMQFEVVENPKKDSIRQKQTSDGPALYSYDLVPPPRPANSGNKDDTYSLLQNPTTPDNNRLSEVAGDFELASITPISNIDRYEELYGSSEQDEKDNTKANYCLVGDLSMHADMIKNGKLFRAPSAGAAQLKQKQKQIRSHSVNHQAMSDGTYCTISEAASIKTPTLFEGSSKILSSKSNYNYFHDDNKIEDTQDSLYQVPPNSNFSENNRMSSDSIPDFPPPSPAAAESAIRNTIQPMDQNMLMSSGISNITKTRSQPLPVNIGDQGDNYHNVNLNNSPAQDLYDNISTNKMLHAGNSYNNGNISNKTSNTEYYESPLFFNRPVSDGVIGDESYQSPASLNRPTSEETDDMYYQAPPSFNRPISDEITDYYQSPQNSAFKEKPAPDIVKRNVVQQYTQVKTKSIKQKRTSTVIKHKILDSIDENKKIEELPKEEQTQPNESLVDTQLNRQTEVENADKNVSELAQQVELRHDLQISYDVKIQNKTEVQLDNEVHNDTEVQHEIQNETEREEQPVPKPGTKIKQSRPSDSKYRSISGGYRMNTFSNETPLNETYEWGKIDSFLSDLENFVVSPDKEKVEYAAVSTEDVPSWLASLHLLQYEAMFMTNGFDDIEFLGHCLDDQDLIELGILDSEHRKALIEASLSLPKPEVIGDSSFPPPQTVGEWLKQIKLEGYEQRFIHNGYANIDRVRVIWELELATVLDITTLGHRKRMINSLGRRIAPVKVNISWAQKFAEADAGKVKTKPAGDETMEMARKLMQTAESLSIDRIQQKAGGDSSNNDCTDGEPDLKINLRAKQTSPTEKEKQSKSFERQSNWKHCADTLLYGEVSYITQYLGSHPVQQVKGVGTTLEACNKMKAISRNVQKLPQITLSISCRGIDYIDSSSMMLISQYELDNVSFCAQDPHNLKVFAYITQDEHTRKNYCHVFKAADVSIAAEIIMTIGQCFEVAYKQRMDLLDTKRNTEPASKASNEATRPVPMQQRSSDAPSKPKPYAESMMEENGSN